mmetsp:Transcript_58374/g.142750  ORF Transcript_58374/g.142750 Transcript_58374/m.142750 type:complete len:136 (+) Transcript_58374:2520-2927(+)
MIVRFTFQKKKKKKKRSFQPCTTRTHHLSFTVNQSINTTNRSERRTEQPARVTDFVENVCCRIRFWFYVLFFWYYPICFRRRCCLLLMEMKQHVLRSTILSYNNRKEQSGIKVKHTLDSLPFVFVSDLTLVGIRS